MTPSKHPSSHVRAGASQSRQLPEFAVRLDRFERLLLIVAVPAAGVFFSRGVHDAFELPKLLLLTLLIGTAVATRVARSIGTAEISVPTHRTAALAAGFLGWAVVVTLAADVPWLAAVGEYSRLGGLWSYFIYVAAFLLAASLFTVRDIEHFAGLMIVAGAAVGGYAVMQMVGADPFTWGGSFADRVFSTLANPNFASGWLSIALSFPVWGILRGGAGRGWRLLSVIAFVLIVMGIYATGSFQGMLAGAVGLAVVWMAWLMAAKPTWFRLAIATSGAVGVAAGGLIAAGLVWQVGPVAALGREAGVALRKHYWATAVSMLGDHPIAGVGFDRFGAYFAQHRPLALVQRLSPELMVDEPHSVPVAMFAEGGFLLGLVYVGFIALTAMALIRGLRVLSGPRLLLLGAVGGGWAGYQVQSFVSIDLPALAVAHWILAAAIVSLVAPEAVSVRDLPWSSPRRRRSSLLAGRVAWAGVAVVTIALLVLAAIPWRADAALKEALAAAQSGRSDDATSWATRARNLGPWPKYLHESANIAWSDDRIGDAVPLLQELVDRDPRRVAALVSLARAYVQLDQLGQAIAAYERVMEVDPLTPRFKAEFAQTLVGADRPGEAVPLLRAAVEVEDDARYWLLLGHAYEDLASPDEAADAFEMAIAAAERDGQSDLLAQARERLRGTEGG